jgi:hypothetical protein
VDVQERNALASLLGFNSAEDSSTDDDDNGTSDFTADYFFFISTFLLCTCYDFRRLFIRYKTTWVLTN